MFNGFFSLDAKFWRTIIPLITKPGKVSDDFINGKRFRYANPFQFYLSISILFFLMLGLSMKYEEYRDLAVGTESTRKANIINFMDEEDFNSEDLDSITEQSKVEVDKQLQAFGLDSVTRNKVQQEIDQGVKSGKKKNTINVNGNTGKLTRMYRFYENNSTIPIGAALDSLKMKKTFMNRFLYRKMSVAKDFSEDSDKANKEFSKELISYASISIFLFLPLFTLFLSFLYVRRNFTYVEHLIFVFHTQTVFFILLSIFLIVNFWVNKENIITIFIILFTIYLILAMKKFYKQGWLKTLFKLFILGQAYFLMAGVGFVIVAAIAFAMY